MPRAAFLCPGLWKQIGAGITCKQAILPLRTRNSDGEVLLIDGVDDDHKATDILQGG